MEPKAIANEHRRIPRHKLTFWVGMCLGMVGMLMAFAAEKTVLGRSSAPAFAIVASVGGTNYSAAVGFAMIIGAFVLFGIAWHLAGKQLGIDGH